jgi:hypothetical protein
LVGRHGRLSFRYRRCRRVNPCSTIAQGTFPAARPGGARDLRDGMGVHERAVYADLPAAIVVAVREDISPPQQVVAINTEIDTHPPLA